MKKCFFLITALLLTFTANAQSTEQEIIDEFFLLYKNNTTKALDYIYDLNDWIDSDGEAVKNLKDKLSQYEDLMGNYLGKEFIGKSRIGKDFSAYIYFAKYERQPIRFTFKFYKPKTKWIVYSFKFDDTFDDDLEEAMKNEYLSHKH